MRRILLPVLLVGFLIKGCNSSSKNNSPDSPVGLIWSEEFDGNSLNDSTWYPELGATGWGNQELQNYTNSNDNIVVSDGKLKIIARKVGTGQGVGDYTSARLLSFESFKYGRIEARAKVPDYKGPGLWPAIWMLGDGIRNGESWPFSGEIDIMEYVSKNPNTYFSTIHSQTNHHSIGTQIESGDIPLNNIEEDFNIYGLIWKEDQLQFYLNDPSNITLTIDRPENPTEENWPFSKPHFFLVNMAIGGTFGGFDVDDANFPATFEIDYIRVFEL